MHAIVFVPAAVFCAVTAISCLVCAVIERRAAARAPVPPAAAARRPRLTVIEGGLGMARRQPPLPAAQSPLRLPSPAQAARSA